MERKINPIAEQSRKWLMEALIVLMKEKSFNDITIIEISERALLSRRTFYRNFASKNELLEKCCENLCLEYIVHLDKDIKYSLEHIVEIYFSFWEKHIDFLQVLIDDNLLCHLIETSNKYWTDIYQRFKEHWNDKSTEIELEYCLFFNMGGLWNILIKWLQQDNRPSPKEMERIIQKSLQNFMKSI